MIWIDYPEIIQENGDKMVLRDIQKLKSPLLGRLISSGNEEVGFEENIQVSIFGCLESCYCS